MIVLLTCTVFAQTDTVTTIYSINQFCAASIREWHLFNLVETQCEYARTKGLELHVHNINSELKCSDSISEQNYHFLDQPSLSDKAVPTRHLQSVS